MKNLFLLPTDKPSRFVTSKDKKTYSLYSIEEFKDIDKFIEYDSKSWDSQNIYITSDEEIKEGDWFLPQGHLNPHKLKGYNKINGDLESYNGLCYDISKCKKIILTTDQDLIKDGVQAIDDEFLEWFVKNPSCEEVEVKPLLSNNGRALFGYKIIIPKEEPRMLTVEDFNKAKISYEEPKEEFLKQERMSGSKTVNKILDGGKPNKFLVDEIGQFNFQKFKLYNEEEVGELVYKIIGEYGNHYGLMIDGEMINELFEKFKKK